MTYKDSTLNSERLNTCIFQEDWWLDAVAPGHWDVAEIRKGDELVGRMPYFLKKKLGFLAMTMPPLTQTLGPWIKPSNSKYAKQLGHQKDIMRGILQSLPACHYIAFSCHHSVSNLLPFYWDGYSIFVKYTYRLPDLSEPDALWSGFLEKVRTDVRKAEKVLSVREDLGIERFLEVNSMTFERQGIKVPYTVDTVLRLDEALAKRNRRKILFAVDATERIHAVSYTIWDEREAYYLMGGANPELRNSGASSLLMWNAILHASTVSQSFDFEGSMIEPVERFVRGFGGIQTPYYRVEKASPLANAALALRRICGRM